MIRLAFIYEHKNLQVSHANKKFICYSLCNCGCVIFSEAWMFLCCQYSVTFCYWEQEFSSLLYKRLGHEVLNIFWKICSILFFKTKADKFLEQRPSFYIFHINRNVRQYFFLSNKVLSSYFFRFGCFYIVNIAPFFATENKSLWIFYINYWKIKFYEYSKKIAQFCFLE